MARFQGDRFWLLVLSFVAGFSVVGPAAAEPYLRSFMLMGADGARIARAVTPEATCPTMTIDGRPRPMRVRAPIETVAQRPTISDPADSKPSVFALTTCEAIAPRRARSVRIAGHRLPLPPAIVRKMVVIGDTGCRLKKTENAVQACNDPKAYPFGQVAAAVARWKPDLVIHVGDYLYRETACPEGDVRCAGSPWGYGSDAWRADFLDPAAPMLEVAPLALARGNHESCNRGGQGWRRFLDVHPFVADQSCDRAADDAVGDFSTPFAVPLGEGAQLILFDSSAVSAAPLAAGDIRTARYRDTYAGIAALAARAPHNILVDHHPLLGFSAKQSKSGEVTLMPGNGGLQSVFGAFSPTFTPPHVDLLFSGHIHLWEMVSFSSAHPAQFIAGFSGTLEDTVPLPPTPPPGATPAPGAVVQAMSSWIEGFGFMTLERAGPDRWHAQVRDVDGRVVNTCEITGSKAACAKPVVASAR